MGIHRIQVKDKNTIGIFLATPPLSRFLALAEKRNEPLEIAVVVGPDPITFFSSVIWAPAGVDKLGVAGALSERPVELVRCSTVDLEVPAHAEIVMEGRIIPGRRQKEGPFGESTGYYLTYDNPVARIMAMTRRKDAIYQGLVPFTQEETVLLNVSWEIDHLREIRKDYPFVKRMHLIGVGLIAIVQIEKRTEADGLKIIDRLFSNPFIKIVIVVDEDVNPLDLHDVLWSISTRVQPDRNIIIRTGMEGMMIDPSASGGEVSADFFSTLIPRTSKMGIDATKPLTAAEKYERIDVSEGVKAKIKPIVERYLSCERTSR